MPFIMKYTVCRWRTNYFWKTDHRQLQDHCLAVPHLLFPTQQTTFLLLPALISSLKVRATAYLGSSLWVWKVSRVGATWWQLCMAQWQPSLGSSTMGWCTAILCLHNVRLLCNKLNTFTSWAWTGTTTGADGKTTGKPFNKSLLSH